MKFLLNRHNPAAFEPVPNGEVEAAVAAPRRAAAAESYTVTVAGQRYQVKVEEGDISAIEPQATAPAALLRSGQPVKAPLAGNIFKVNVKTGDSVQPGDVIIILEAMKMETEVRTSLAGTVGVVSVKDGDAVAVGDTLLMIE